MGPVEVLWDGDGYPRKDMGPVEVLWEGDWVPLVDRQTPVKTVPSSCTTSVGGNNNRQVLLLPRMKSGNLWSQYRPFKITIFNDGRTLSQRLQSVDNTCHRKYEK